MRARSARAWRTWPRLGALLALALMLVVVPVPSTALAADLEVHVDQAVVDFPNAITFTLVADAPQPVVQLELRYRAAYAPVTQVARPAVPSDPHVDVTYPLDMRIHYLPPGIDVIYRWRLTLADGTVLETPDKTVFYMDQRHPWQTLNQGQVRLYYYAGNPDFAQAAMDTTVRSIERFKETFQVRADEPVRVVMYGSERDFAAVLPANSDEWIGGFADPELHLIVVAIMPGDTDEIQRMLSHEVVHLAVAQATENPFNEPPAWLNEGLASYYQEIPDPRFQPILDQAIESGRLDSIRALNSSFPTDPTGALLSYAESESIVRFIIEARGADRMAALIQVFQDGVSYDDAVQHALGMSLDELDREWKAWLDYKGDAPAATSTVPASGDHDRFITTAVMLWVVGLGAVSVAALLSIVAGVILIRRSRHAKREIG